MSPPGRRPRRSWLPESVEQAQRRQRTPGIVLVLEEAVDGTVRCEVGLDRAGDRLEALVRVGRVAPAVVAERRVRLRAAHADGAALGEERVDRRVVPRLVAKLDRHLEARVERVEEQREEAVVAW